MKNLLRVAFTFSLFILHGEAKPASRIIFIGDSITANWNLDVAFPGVGIRNAGIGGQTSGEILARFDQDVLSRKPEVVLIEAGTNDLYYDCVPTDETHTNIEQMITLSQAHGIRVVLVGTVPVSSIWEAFRNPKKIIALNNWLRETAAAHGVQFVDYYSVLDGHPELTKDGLHPNDSGYRLLAPRIAAAL